MVQIFITLVLFLWAGEVEGLPQSLGTPRKWEKERELDPKSQVSVIRDLYTFFFFFQTLFLGYDINQKMFLLPKILLTHMHLWPWDSEKRELGLKF